MAVTVGEYKGNATLSLHKGADVGKYPFTFGVSKARLILANLDHIRAFVRDFDPQEEEATGRVMVPVVTAMQADGSLVIRGQEPTDGDIIRREGFEPSQERYHAEAFPIGVSLGMTR